MVKTLVIHAYTCNDCGELNATTVQFLNPLLETVVQWSTCRGCGHTVQVECELSLVMKELEQEASKNDMG